MKIDVVAVFFFSEKFSIHSFLTRTFAHNFRTT